MEISSPSTWNDWWNPENNGWPEHFCSTCTIYTYIWYYMCMYIYIYIAHIHIILSPNLYVIFIEKSNHPCGFQEFTVVIWKKWDSNGNPSESNPWRPRWFEFLFSTRCPSHSHHMFPFARLHGFKNPPFIHLSIQFSSVLTWLVSFIETTSETMSIPVFFPMVFPWRLTGHLCGFGVSLPRFLGSLALLVAAAELRNVAVVVSLGSIGIQGAPGICGGQNGQKRMGKMLQTTKERGTKLAESRDTLWILWFDRFVHGSELTLPNRGLLSDFTRAGFLETRLAYNELSFNAEKKGCIEQWKWRSWSIWVIKKNRGKISRQETPNSVGEWEDNVW